MRLSRTMAYMSNIRNLLEIPLDQLDLSRHHHILPSSFRSVSQSRSLLREQAQTPAAQVGLVLEDLADLFDATVPWLQDVGNALSDESVVMVEGRGLTGNEQLSRILRTARIIQVMSLIHHFLGSALNTASIDRRRNNRSTTTAEWPPNNTRQTGVPNTAPMSATPTPTTPPTHHSSPQLAQTNNLSNAALNPSAIMSNAFATLNSLTPGRNTGGNNSINLNAPNTNSTTQNQPGNYSNSMTLNSPTPTAPTDRQNMRPNNPGRPGVPPNVINQAASRASMTLNSLNSLLNSTRATLAQANAGRGRAPPPVNPMHPPHPIHPHNNNTQVNNASGSSITLNSSMHQNIPQANTSPRYNNNSITLNSSDDPLGYPPGRHSPKRQKRNDGH
ncbi:hypothetical protein K501DRAFT_338608 [Backusella circina FSU 941]|nr:hypothetical protein K501DRAFT_338608 [Backusella circina FSU 941]